MWSSIEIQGAPRLLVVDGFLNIHGWESDFCHRVTAALRRRGVEVVGGAPLLARNPDDLQEALREPHGFNCIFLLCHGGGEAIRQEASLGSYWTWLSNYKDLTAKLLAVCNCDGYNAETTGAVLGAKGSFAVVALAQQTPLIPRAAGLFFVKFFTELHFHALDSISGKMAWFSHAKARELLKRAHYQGKVGIRC